MTGNIIVKDIASRGYKSSKQKDTDPAVWPPSHTKLLLTFDDNEQVAFVDARRLGRIWLAKSPEEVVADLAPDALNELPTVEEICAKVTNGGSAAIKTTLLDQRAIVSGIGNWMVDDTLMLAGIHPETKTNALNKAQCASLRQALGTVSRLAVDSGADSSKLPADWLIHVRWDSLGKRGLVTNGAERRPVCILKVGGRTTLYVPSLQFKTLPEADTEEKTSVNLSGKRVKLSSKKQSTKE